MLLDASLIMNFTNRLSMFIGVTFSTATVMLKFSPETIVSLVLEKKMVGFTTASGALS